MSELNFILVLFLLGLIFVSIGYFTSKNITNNEDYFLAGRKLGFWALTSTLVATQLGGGVIIGSSEASYRYGIYGILYTLGFALGFAVLSLGVAQRYKAFNVATLSELLGREFSSKLLRKMTSALSIIALSGLFLGQIVATEKMMMGLGVYSDILFYSLWAVIITYTVLGGLNAVVMTDSVQIVMVLLVFVSVFIYIATGDSNFAQNVKDLFISINANSNDAQSSQLYSSSGYINLILMPFLFCFVEQDIAQRLFSAKSKKVAALAAITSGIVLLLFAFIPVYIGSLGKEIDLSTIATEEKNIASYSILMLVLSSKVGEFFIFIAALGLLAAIISTADSLLCAISSNIALDFEIEKKLNVAPLTISRTITALVGISSLLIANASSDVFEILVGSYNILVMTIFAPIMVILFLPQYKSKTAAFASIFFGATVFVALKLLSFSFYPNLIALALSFVAYMVFYLLYGTDKVNDNNRL